MEGHSECFSKRVEEVRDEFQTSVRGDMGWDFMLREHMCNKELGKLRGSDGVVSRMNMACFDRRSTMMRMEVNPLEEGSCSMKSMEIECHG